MSGTGFWDQMAKKNKPREATEGILRARADLGYLPDSVSQSLHPAIETTGTRWRLTIAMMFLAPQLKQRTNHWPTSGSAGAVSGTQQFLQVGFFMDG